MILKLENVLPKMKYKLKGFDDEIDNLELDDD